MDKAPEAFRTISEVGEDLDLPQHVLRFWESRFTQIKPMKRGGGRRYYRPDDVALLRGIRHLLYGQGYTIRGVQRILRERGARFVQTMGEAGAEAPPPPSPADGQTEVVASPGAIREERGLFAHVPAPPPEAASDIDDSRSEMADPVPAAERVEPSFEGVMAGSTRARALQPEATPAHGIDETQLAQLRAVLDDLSECRRLLASALTQE